MNPNPRGAGQDAVPTDGRTAGARSAANGLAEKAAQSGRFNDEEATTEDGAEAGVVDTLAKIANFRGAAIGDRVRRPADDPGVREDPP